MTTGELILWVVAVLVGVFIIRLIFPLILAGVGLVLAGIVALFALDKARGGTAIDQLVTKIENWIRRRVR